MSDNTPDKEAAKIFLRQKEILAEDKNQWIIKFSDGREIDLVELFSEFAAVARYHQSPDDWEYQAKALSAIKKGLEVSLMESMEECERLAGVVKFWQDKYHEVNPGWQPAKIDNL